MEDQPGQMQVRRPAVRETRGERHLFVWGDVGQWLVVDAEAATLLDHLIEGEDLTDGLSRHARSCGDSRGNSTGEVRKVVEALRGRGIIHAVGEAPAPRTEPLNIANLTFNITNRCNLKCPWCYNQRSENVRIPITDLLRWLNAGKSVLDANATLIILGGEPFLDEPRLLEVVQGAREVFADEILVSTNGTLLSDKAPRILAHEKVTVQISIDSATASEHDAIRGKGVFDKAVSNTRRLVDAGVHTVLSMVITRGREAEFEAYFELAEKIGAAEVRFIPLRRIGAGATLASQAPDLFGSFTQLVTLLRRRPELKGKLRRDFFSILMTACRFSHLRDNCGIGRRCLFVDADGAIYPCPNHRGDADRCGDVRTTALADLLEESSVMEAMRHRCRVSEIHECCSCAFRYWCAGDCRAEALAVNGSLSAPSPYCASLRKTMQEMMWLIADGWQGMAPRDQAVVPWS